MYQREAARQPGAHIQIPKRCCSLIRCPGQSASPFPPPSPPPPPDRRLLPPYPRASQSPLAAKPPRPPVLFSPASTDVVGAYRYDLYLKKAGRLVAEVVCVGRGGHLLSIMSGEENTVVPSQLLPAAGVAKRIHLWMGYAVS